MAAADLLRPALLAAARSPRMERTVSRIPVTKGLVDRFVAGETEDQAVAATTDRSSAPAATSASTTSARTPPISGRPPAPCRIT